MELTTLTAVTLSAILSVTADSKWVNGEDRPRLEQVAKVMAQTVLDEGCISSKDKQCEEVSALALVAVAFHESGFAADVQDCSRCVPGGEWCDHGRAQTAYQMQRNNWDGNTRAAICEDFGLATRLAYKALGKGRGSWKNKFMTYAGRPTSGLELYKQHQTILMIVQRKRDGKSGS